MKSYRPVLFITHIFLFFSAVGVLGGSLFLPWAYVRVALGLVRKPVYLYQSSELHLIEILLPLIIVITLAIGLYGLFFNQHLRIGILNLLIGFGTIGWGVYVWLKIDDKDIHFLGINPLKLAEVHPDIGVLFLIMAGFLLAGNGIAYLFSRRLSKG